MTRRVTLALVLAAVLAAQSAAVLAQASEYPTEPSEDQVVAAEGTAAGELALVRMYCDAGQSRRAIQAAKRYLKLYNDPAGREEVMLLAGEAEMKHGRLFQGYEWFEKQLAEYPGGRLSERALNREFEVAEAFLAGQKRIILFALRVPARDDGLEILSRVAEHAPGTPLAQRAMLRIAEDRFQRSEWLDAVEAYDRYLAAFPQGDRAAEAMLRAAQATFHSFTGVPRDETPLIEAEQRYREFSRRFPISAAEAGVAATLAQIRLIRATKLLEEGRFYERVGKATAAAYTYRRVIDAYPSTDAADQAAIALSILTGEPIEPTTRPARTAVAVTVVPPLVPVSPQTQPAVNPHDLDPIDLETFHTTTAPAGESP